MLLYGKCLAASAESDSIVVIKSSSPKSFTFFSKISKIEPPLDSASSRRSCSLVVHLNQSTAKSRFDLFNFLRRSAK